jgi:hypothetical protein
MEVRIRLPAETMDRLKALAELAGMSPEDYAVGLLRERLSDDWADADAALAQYDRTGDYVGAEEAMAKFERDVEEGLAARKSA